MDEHLALAAEILPLLRANSLRGLTRTSGYYAFRTGQDAKAVGSALHLIGAACVLTRTPVAPLHFVEYLEEEWRGVFAIAAADSVHADAWPVMCTAARLHAYSENDFDHVTRVFPELRPYAQAGETPLGLWRVVVDHAFAPAIQCYAQILAQDGPALKEPAGSSSGNTSRVGRRALFHVEPYATGLIPGSLPRL